ncbi:hypothetical protein C9E81_01875 [Paracoccus alkanivorans]|uniref:Uncharacterized protein n=1 Tax=Paracoccus alkanivorans TaxID=2116655 RepID=A0A3M0MJA6_9RHOB|nr:hypothetical protein C9E81_01875 [Paracoccus alkanivorans]
MGRSLPSWADEPLDRHQAARALGICSRTLTDRLKQWPYYERRGRKLVFYPEHIRQLREAFKCQDCSSKSEAERGTPPEPLAANAFEKALELATRGKPKNSGRNTKRGSGNVIPMAKRP